ncbi:MAG: RagB/SusD family nutrient uptake outer membrane protein, partial [Cyclobacteriaceae bacterium]|nr:RagB/SusD family nutrient uptake outer membrane protein [Cyclobacteriaceae bacterium]
MKNLINRTIVLGLLLSVLSCTDLVEEPVGLLAPEAFFKSVKDVETSVLGSYAYIASEQFYGRKLVLSLQLRSDMADIGDRNTPGRRQQVNDFNMDSNNGMITSFWPRAYQIIGAANAGIAGAELVGEPADKIGELKAEATFIRAFVYYHLVRVFGDIPYIDFFINNPEEIKEISKTPEAQVYEKIIQDLAFAKVNLPDSYGGLRSRPTKGTAAAYLASIYLTLGQDQLAYDEAKWVIDNKASFGYELMPDFQELFDASNADGLTEHIFMIDFLGQVTGGGNVNTDWMGPITGIRSVSLPNTNAGWSVSVPAFDVFDTWDARDYRRKVSFIDSAYIDDVLVGYDQFAPNHGSARPHQGKYWRLCGNHRSDCGQSDNNYSAMRYAEV